MNRQDIETALNTYAAAKNRHDLDAIIAACAPDGYYESVGMGARVQGADALRAFYGELFKTLPDYYGAFDGVAYGEDCAVVWGRFGGTMSDSFMGMPVQPGRKLDIPVTFVCTFRDGLLLSDVGYFDVQTLYAQAGLSAPAQGASSAFVERFKSFWAAPSGARLPELIADDATITWPGAAPMNRAAYIAHIDGVLALMPGMKIEVRSHAQQGEDVFIAWRGHVAINDKVHHLTGVDRFRVKNGIAIEEDVTFDRAAFQEVLNARMAHAA